MGDYFNGIFSTSILTLLRKLCLGKLSEGGSMLNAFGGGYTLGRHVDGTSAYARAKHRTSLDATSRPNEARIKILMSFLIQANHANIFHKHN